MYTANYTRWKSFMFFGGLIGNHVKLSQDNNLPAITPLCIIGCGHQATMNAVIAVFCNRKTI